MVDCQAKSDFCKHPPTRSAEFGRLLLSHEACGSRGIGSLARMGEGGVGSSVRGNTSFVARHVVPGEFSTVCVGHSVPTVTAVIKKKKKHQRSGEKKVTHSCLVL